MRKIKMMILSTAVVSITSVSPPIGAKTESHMAECMSISDLLVKKSINTIEKWFLRLTCGLKKLFAEKFPNSRMGFTYWKSQHPDSSGHNTFSFPIKKGCDGELFFGDRQDGEELVAAFA